VRYLAIDLGDKRTGLAVGDDVTRIVSPVAVLHVPCSPDPERLLREIERSIEAHAPGAMVIGLPLNMDDTEGPQAAAVRAFGAALQQRTGLLVHFQDERLTSFQADQQLAQSGKTHKEKRSVADALAAANILRDFFDAMNR